MVIDFHTHILPPAARTERGKYAARDHVFAGLFARPEARIATAEDLIESMDRDGVECSVVQNFGWSTHELCVETNDYILETVARYPKRLFGFCSIQPGAGRLALAELERCARCGARGLGEMRPDGQDFDINNIQIMEPILQVLRQYRMLFLTHASEPVGHLYPGKGTVTPQVLYPFITRAPDVTIICAHWGGGLPFYALMPEVGKALANVYFDTAASSWLYTPEVYREVIRLVGAGKVLFGTDYPLLPPQRLLREIKSLELGAEVEAQVLSGNARKLLGI